MDTAAPELDRKALDARVRGLVAEARWGEVAAELGPAAQDLPVLPATAANAYRAYRALGDDAAAERWLARALALAPANATLHRDQGVLHQKRGDWARAADSFEAAVALRGDVAAYRGNLATALFHCARYAQAAEHYRAGLALDAAQPLWWRRLARALVHLNEPAEAARAYTRALELQEDAATRGALDEVLRQMRSGSRAASAVYYDAVFADSPRYAQGGEASEYAPAWQAIVELLRGSGSRRILDLGCGPGQFAEYLAGQMPGIEYTGIDFSGVAISRARQRCPNFLFEKRELPITRFTGLPAFDTAVCTEVLEHVEADREILAALPRGTRIVASVPNYDAFGHLRTFEDADAVRRRYGVVFDDLQVRAAPLSAQRTLWLLDGRRSSAALPAEEHEAPSLGSVDLAATVVDCVLWTDGTRYAQDFLPQFGLPFVTVADAVGLAEPHVALRHDVDWSIEAAYAMAVVEHGLGIRSSYYLLHPDGNVTSRNYFGQVADGRLAIDPRLFDWAARLTDLGHEVGLHNDLISLALATRRQPAEFLEQIVEAFARRGMPLAGSVAHGSHQSREMGYQNYQIFADFQDQAIAPDCHEPPERFERLREPRAEQHGHAVDKFALRMADYGLRYEANFVAREIHVSDSAARWTLWHEGEPVRLEKFAPRERMQNALAAALRRKRARSGVQCLVHACHWSALAHPHLQGVPAVRVHVRHHLARARTEAMLQRLAAFDNVIVARSEGRVEPCVQEHDTEPRRFEATSGESSLIDRLVSESGIGVRDVLEVGCGQGDLLATVTRRLQARAGNGVAVRGLGVDGSPGAIVTCAARYPDLRWAADPPEHFLAAHDEIVREEHGEPVRYDMVLDTTGAIGIDSDEAALDHFARIDALMRPGALYVCVASRHDCGGVLRNEHCSAWPRDWLTLAGDTWRARWSADDVAPEPRGCDWRVFRKGGAQAAPSPADGTAQS